MNLLMVTCAKLESRLYTSESEGGGNGRGGGMGGGIERGHTREARRFYMNRS